jgi:hypothetical protein
MTIELENTQTSLAATRDKSDSKSKALDLQVFHADEAMLRLKNTESQLKAAEEDLKNQMQLLESAQKILSMHENSFNMMISLAVAHAAVAHAAVGIDSENFVYARKLLQHDDFLSGDPCYGAIQ